VGGVVVGTVVAVQVIITLGGLLGLGGLAFAW